MNLQIYMYIRSYTSILIWEWLETLRDVNCRPLSLPIV